MRTFVSTTTPIDIKDGLDLESHGFRFPFSKLKAEPGKTFIINIDNFRELVDVTWQKLKATQTMYTTLFSSGTVAWYSERVLQTGVGESCLTHFRTKSKYILKIKQGTLDHLVYIL